MKIKMTSRNRDYVAEIETPLSHFWSMYKRETRLFWKVFPEIFLAGKSIFLTPVKKKNGKKKNNGIRRSVIDHLRHFGGFFKVTANDRPFFPACDVLVFYSSKKNSVFPALDILAERIAEKGFRCAVVFNARTMTVYEKKGQDRDIAQTVMPDYSSFMGKKWRGLVQIRIMIRSIVSGIIVFGCLFKKYRGNGESLLYYIYTIWNSVYQTLKLSESCDYLLKSLKPRILIVNNEQVQMGGSLVHSKYAKKMHKIFFCNERVSSDLFPVFSDEVWVWNSVMKKEMSSRMPAGDAPKISVSGCVELSHALNADHDHESFGRSMQKNIKEKNIFLLLLNYLADDKYNLPELVLETSQWIAAAAEAQKDWHFIIKTRLYYNSTVFPGSHLFSNLKNVSIYKGNEMGLNDFLTWNNLKVVGANLSTGLYVAAGAGKPAFRMHSPEYARSNCVLDDTCLTISSAEELTGMLKKIASGKNEISDFFNEIIKNKALFPYRSDAICKMETLCLANLKTM